MTGWQEGHADHKKHFTNTHNFPFQVDEDQRGNLPRFIEENGH